MKSTRKAKGPFPSALVNGPAIIAMLEKLKSREYGWLPYGELPEDVRSQFESAARHLSAREVAQLAELVSKSGAVKGLSSAALIDHWNSAWRAANAALPQTRGRRTREAEAAVSETTDGGMETTTRSEALADEVNAASSAGQNTPAEAVRHDALDAEAMRSDVKNGEQADEDKFRGIRARFVEAAASRPSR